MIFYIYHLPGKKVGITNNPQRRFLEYRKKGYSGPIEIIEKLDCTVKEAGNREWEWATRFGYPRGYHYVHSWAQNVWKKPSAIRRTLKKK